MSVPNILTERETPSPKNSQLLPPKLDSIVGTYKSRGEYWLGASNHDYTATCNCLEDPCSCNNKEVPEFTREDVVAHLYYDAPIPGYIVDTKHSIGPVFCKALEKNQV